MMYHNQNFADNGHRFSDLYPPSAMRIVGIIASVILAAFLLLCCHVGWNQRSYRCTSSCFFLIGFYASVRALTALALVLESNDTDYIPLLMLATIFSAAWLSAGYSLHLKARECNMERMAERVEDQIERAKARGTTLSREAVPFGVVMGWDELDDNDNNESDDKKNMVSL